MVHTIQINNVPSFPGFFENGTSSTTGKNNITIQNFITDSSNSTLLSVSGGARGGWLCSSSFSRSASNNTIQNCSNRSNIIGFNNGRSVGGICGAYLGADNGSVQIINCSNSGNINITALYGGGICGFSPAIRNGSVQIINCSNTGPINAQISGGICGGSAAQVSGNVIFTNCSNTGNISGNQAGGICGAYAGYNNGSVQIIKCYNTGNISGSQAGGICGSQFGYNTNAICNVENCYNIGLISGNNSGGICGSMVGYSDDITYTTTIINIKNCYTTGNISTTCGGICGGFNVSLPNYLYRPTINISNNYTYGTFVDASSGILATSIQSQNINFTISNCYIANGTWNDASANSLLTNTPISIYQQGTTWTRLASNSYFPYLLSSFNSNIYNPNSVITNNENYTSSPGLFSGQSYTIISITKNSNIYTESSISIEQANGKIHFNDLQSKGVYVINVATEIPKNPLDVNNNIFYSYNFNNLSVTLNLVCFKEDTKILTNKGYIPIQDLRNGDLIKTLKNDYKPIYMIGKKEIYHPACEERIKEQLYKCSKEQYPDVFEDLIITGCHSILMDHFVSYEQIDKIKEINGDIYMTDGLYRWPACVDFRTSVYEISGNYTIYHIALENEDYYDNYGIYANGLLVETCSKRYLKEIANMTIIE